MVEHQIIHESKRELEEYHSQEKGGGISSDVNKTKGKKQQTQKQTEIHIDEDGMKKGDNKDENEGQEIKPGDKKEKVKEECSEMQQKNT